MSITKFRNIKKIKSPLNYIGGKTRILDQILPLFPKKIDRFIDLFAGGCNVGINVDAERIYFNDNLTYLIDMYQAFISIDLDSVINHIENRINEFQLSLTNDLGYKEMRKIYNRHKNPLDLFVLIAFSFNHQIRFNNNHHFNNPFGRERSSFNNSMKQNLIEFIIRLKNNDVQFFNNCFTDFDFTFLTEDDFVYCDPPYLITTGTYNDGKRGFKGWTEREEYQLLKILNKLDSNNIRFALSNVLKHKEKTNNILFDWVNENPQYNVNYIDSNYSNSNYQTLIRNKKASVEVLITNYQPQTPLKENTLFDDFYS